MPGGSGLLEFDDFEPGIFAGRLVKVSVNANIFWQAMNSSNLRLMFMMFIILT